MVRFGICDDDVEYMKFITDIICQSYEQMKTFPDMCQCILYQSGQELIEQFEKDKIDIAFIDIECGEESGFDIARKLIKRKEDLGIIYITNYWSYVSKAFVCRPLGFIYKGAFKEDIMLPMRNVIEYLEGKKKIITFLRNKGNLELKINDIIVVEVFNHELRITLRDRVLTCQGQLANYEPVLINNGFIKIARGILINKMHIEKNENDKILTDNGLSYTVSRRRKKEVRILLERELQQNGANI